MNRESNVNPDPVAQSRYNDRIIGTISMGLGILALMTGFIPIIGWFSLAPGILGVLVGIVGIVMASRHHHSAKRCYWGILVSILGVLPFLLQNLLLVQKP